ncbi:hypothetical protein ANCCAN_05924 [Ancylostoma caninum]|uniref:G-protein coupled receptors family 1 profile domain-containing protein n=1 Tax=Ancylostoma caninum TaxID=29170 RepID=A0A368GYA4_ANCCA|nr:hypothetical protein ANCCAN_05924 [Ancylostoma caninum]
MHSYSILRLLLVLLAAVCVFAETSQTPPPSCRRRKTNGDFLLNTYTLALVDFSRIAVSMLIRVFL